MAGDFFNNERIQMLVLSRKVGEEIVIGDDIVIRVISASGVKAKLGITAPDDVPVNRREIYDQISRLAEGTGEQDGDGDDSGAG